MIKILALFIFNVLVIKLIPDSLSYVVLEHVVRLVPEGVHLALVVDFGGGHNEAPLQVFVVLVGHLESQFTVSC